MALLEGGGYATYVRAPLSQVIPLALLFGSHGPTRESSKERPGGRDERQTAREQEGGEEREVVLAAAALPEAYLTAFQCLLFSHPDGGIRHGQRVLIHAGGSGVGTAAIRLCRAVGALPYVTCSPGKVALCKQVGAEEVFPQIRGETPLSGGGGGSEGKGGGETPWPQVDCILDPVFGTRYFKAGMAALNSDGMYIVLSFLGGHRLENISCLPLIQKRARVLFSTLRSQSVEYKQRMVSEFVSFAANRFRLFQNLIFNENTVPDEHSLYPIIDSVIPLSAKECDRPKNMSADEYATQQLKKAHERLELNRNFGTVILKW